VSARWAVWQDAARLLAAEPFARQQLSALYSLEFFGQLPLCGQPAMQALGSAVGRIYHPMIAIRWARYSSIELCFVRKSASCSSDEVFSILSARLATIDLK
jgi:hypothetical protein